MKTYKLSRELGCVLAGFLWLILPNMGNSQVLVDADSLEEVTVVGTIYVDSAGSHIRYLMDEGSDGFMDYNVHFGPYWYQPAEGLAVRPQDGDVVTLFGGLNNAAVGNLPVLFVYEIDGEFWRDPFEPSWNQLNEDYSVLTKVYPDGLGICLLDTLDEESFTGKVMVDSTFKDLHYFLDANNDEYPDYRLNFGPPWYDPASGISYPNDGDEVEILGIIVHLSVYPVVVVLELDGMLWRDVKGFANHGQGRWMNGQLNVAETVYCPFDTLNRIQFRAGWHHGGMPGNMYCQLLQVHPQNLPAFQHENQYGFAAFAFGWYNQNQLNLMKQNQHRMQVNNLVHVQMHYTDGQLTRAGIQQHDRTRLNYWDMDQQAWIEVPDVSYDFYANTLEFETNVVYAYYLLTGDASTTSFEPLEMLNMGTCIFPNPVKQVANIHWVMTESQGATLHIYNQLGQAVYEHSFIVVPVGLNQIQYIPNHNLPNGMYILSVNTPAGIEVVKFLLER